MQAPCGHPGEAIVGTYVRCLSGCEGSKPPAKRGIEGHVTDCACVGCGNCRRVRQFTVRAKDGTRNVLLGWVGEASPVAALSVFTGTGKLRHLNAVDVDGRVLASHPIFFDARAGDKLDFTFDPATLSFSSVRHWGARLSDYVKITITADAKSWKERYESLYDAPGWRTPLYPESDIRAPQIPRAGGTLADVRARALAFPDIEEVRVEEGNGVVHVKVLRGADRLSGSSMRDLENHLAAHLPVGIRYRAHLMTPQHYLMREVKKAHGEACYKVDLLGCNVEETLKYACKEITRGLKRMGYGQIDAVYDPGSQRVTASLRYDHKTYYMAFQLSP